MILPQAVFQHIIWGSSESQQRTRDKTRQDLFYSSSGEN